MNASPWRLSLAGPEDDGALRLLLRETPLSGSLTATLEREPSFFGGDVDAPRHDVILARYENEPAGCGSRVLRRAWWLGEPADTAYLADLRVRPDFQRRAGRPLARGYRLLEECAASHPAAVTWTAIFENNRRARGVLTGRHAGLPAYQDRGRLLCPALIVPRRAKFPMLSGISWQTGTADSLEEITSFLTKRQRHRPLAPAHTVEDFAAGKRWPGLRPCDFLLARRGGQLAGVVAVWDQRAFRQVRVKRLSAGLRALRPVWNTIAGLTGGPPLPPENSVLPMAHAAFLAVEDDSVPLARGLLKAARAAAAVRGIGWLCVCLHETDPLATAPRGLPALASHGRLYQVSDERPHWPQAAAPVIESATL